MPAIIFVYLMGTAIVYGTGTTQKTSSGTELEKVTIPVSNNSTVKDFSLFIEMEPTLIAFKARVSQVMYSIRIGFTAAENMALQKKIKNSFLNFEKIPFINKSETLSASFLSLMSNAYDNLVTAEASIDYILKYTDPLTEEPFSTCNITLEELTSTELERLHLNIEDRLSKIK